MRTLSFLFWTTCSVALGIWMATVPVGDRTPWEHAKHVWANNAAAVPGLRDLAKMLPSAEHKPGAAAPQITERHTPTEREAVNRLIARSATK